MYIKLFVLVFSPWPISNNTDEKSKEVIIHLHPQEGSYVHAQSLLTNQEQSRYIIHILNSKYFQQLEYRK